MPKKQDMFAERLRFIREMREMSQSDVDKAAGFAPSQTAHFEGGRRKPSFDNLRALCKALVVSADYLLSLSERVTR